MWNTGRKSGLRNLDPRHHIICRLKRVRAVQKLEKNGAVYDDRAVG